MNTYLSLAIIVTMLIAAIILSLRLAKRLGVPVAEVGHEGHAH